MSEVASSSALFQSKVFYEGCVSASDKKNSKCNRIKACRSNSDMPMVLEYTVAPIWEGNYFASYPEFTKVLKEYYEEFHT